MSQNQVISYEGIEQLLHRADVTMYEAKQSQGNSLVITPELEGVTTVNMAQPSSSH